MRPLRLEMEGFASFRERTVIDFDDADLFVLTGPTGAGKSSVLDAMIFALYGSVPRYDNTSLVAPAITQGKSEAKVRLDFAVGPEAYTAVRVVRRTATGATTREARLERRQGEGTVVLAGNARELTERVQEILGLGFDHFVRCVVLPQGAFASFLRATPGERQELLIQLLDLRLYRQMRQIANGRAGERRATAAHLRRQLDEEHGHATREAVREAKRRTRELGELARRLRLEAPALEEAERVARSEDGRAAESRRQADALVAVRPDPRGAELAEEQRRLEEAARRAEAERAQAATRLAESREVRAGLPAETRLARWVDLRRRQVTVEEELAGAAERAETARGVSAAAAERRGAAEGALEASEKRLDAMRSAHQAADLARGLGAGDPCPVCGRPLAEPPAAVAVDDLDGARAERDAARSALRAARSEAESAAAAAARAQERLVSSEEARRGLAEELQEAPAAGEVERQLAAVRAAEEAVRGAEEAWRAAEEAQGAVVRRREALGDRLAAAWRRFDETRDGLAALEPPPTEDRDDLQGAWTALGGWAVATEPLLRERAREAEEAAAERRTEAGEGLSRWLDECAEVEVTLDEVEPGGGASVQALREALAAAAARADAEAKALEASHEKAKELKGRAKEVEAEAAVSASLARQLSSHRFERWLLGRALASLTDGASRILLELSSGQYSLAADEKGGFEVVDHTNADEPRSAKTLSGGETFLASLALALALAEDVSRLAARGAARLEALFLDEGFGSLDPETLDVVAGAIEGLGAQGRMVGLVTHVRELAERLPVRFLVQKTARTSSVRREG